MNIKQKGFTLIELLVVIAIIGLLAAVVLASLSGARNKGKDASAEESMASIRSQAELWSSNNGNSYGTANAASTEGSVDPTGTPNADISGVCADTAKIEPLLAAAAQNTGNTAYCDVGINGGSFVAYVQLSSGSTFCVDNSGFSGSTTPAVVDPTAASGVSCK